jgi:hypothetical protein
MGDMFSPADRVNVPQVRTPELTQEESQAVQPISAEDKRLAADQAKFIEDERLARFRGRGSTILTGGQGAADTANVNKPTLIGS